MPLMLEISSTPFEEFFYACTSAEDMGDGWTDVTLACGHVLEVLHYAEQATMYCGWCHDHARKVLKKLACK